jgi:hypothetical protein
MKFNVAKQYKPRWGVISFEVLGFVRKTSEKNYRENIKEDPEASVESIIKSFKNL